MPGYSHGGNRRLFLSRYELCSATDNSQRVVTSLMDLSDACVAKIMISSMSGVERSRAYPAIYSTENLRSSYVNKGQAAKLKDEDSGFLRYQVVFGIFEIHGDEGEVKGSPLIRAVLGLRPHGDYNLQAGLLCEDQSLDYDFSAAAERAQAVCLKLESKQRTTEAMKQPKATSTTEATPQDQDLKGNLINRSSDAELGSRRSLFGPWTESTTSGTPSDSASRKRTKTPTPTLTATPTFDDPNKWWHRKLLNESVLVGQLMRDTRSTIADGEIFDYRGSHGSSVDSK